MKNLNPQQSKGEAVMISGVVAVVVAMFLLIIYRLTNRGE